MYSLIDSQHSFLRTSYTLASAVEAFLYPVTAVLVLLASALATGHHVGSAYMVVAVLTFSLLFPGVTRFNDPPRRVLRKVATSWLLFAAVLGSFGVASGYINNFPQAALINWTLLTPFALLAAHFVARHILLGVLAKTGKQRTAVVCGVNEVGLRLTRQFLDNPYLGCRVVGFFDDRALDRLPETNNIPTLGRIGDLAEFVKTNRIDHIYLAIPMASQPRILGLLDDLKDTTASVFFVPDIFVTDLIQGQIHSISGIPVVAVCETPFTGFRGIAKRLSDIAISTVLLIPLAPVMLFVALGVRMSSSGPVIFRQKRYGLDGQEIIVYKFRSMTVTEDGNRSYTQVTKQDARVTKFGSFIRKTSLDELPQFINVLQGRMSIVGPRPHAIAVNEQYRRLIPGYMVRHKVKPGITGWAQVNGYRGGDDLEHMKKRIEFDLEYLKNWSLSHDIWIIFKTVAVVFKDKHAY